MNPNSYSAIARRELKAACDNLSRVERRVGEAFWFGVGRLGILENTLLPLQAIDYYYSIQNQLPTILMSWHIYRDTLEHQVAVYHKDETATMEAHLFETEVTPFRRGLPEPEGVFIQAVNDMNFRVSQRYDVLWRNDIKACSTCGEGRICFPDAAAWQKMRGVQTIRQEIYVPYIRDKKNGWLCPACEKREEDRKKEQKALASGPVNERSKMSTKLRYKVLKRDGFRCKFCGVTSADGAKLHVDHIIPISRGGKTEMDNLQTLCSDCNLGKRTDIA